MAPVDSRRMRSVIARIGFAMGMFLMVTNPVSSSAPGVFKGPNTYLKFVAKVVSVKKVSLSIATSDVGAKPAEYFWEVQMDLLSAALFNADDDQKMDDSAELGRVVYHFPITEKILEGFQIEGVTESRKRISERWHSQNTFLKRFIIHPRK